MIGFVSPEVERLGKEAPRLEDKMRNITWIFAAALALSTTGCLQTMDSGYPSYGYNGGGYNGGGYSQGYYQPGYQQPAYQPVYVPQTRYVAVPTPAPQHTFSRPPEHNERHDEHHDDQHHDDHPSANNGHDHNNRDSDHHG
jgi:hypothetical protein